MSLPTMMLNPPQQPSAPTSASANSSARSQGASERAADFDAKVAQELGEQTQQQTMRDGSTEAGESSENSAENAAPIVLQAPVDQSQIAFELIISQDNADAGEQELVPEVAAPEVAPSDSEAPVEIATELVEQVAVPQPGAQDVPVELAEDDAETNTAVPRSQESTPREGTATPQHREAAPAPANTPQPVLAAPPTQSALDNAAATPQPVPSETAPPVVVTNEPATPQPNAPQQPAQTVPVVATAPVITQTPAVAEPAPVAAQPATTPAGMLEQVRGPIGRLAQAVPGEHTFTVNVTPENLGPVTVRAHIGTEGIRVELIGATDGARDSLRAILNDLKRDLQSTGMNAQLDVGSERSDARDQFGAQEFGRHAQRTSGTRADAGSPQIVENDPATTSLNRHPDALSVDIVA